MSEDEKAAHAAKKPSKKPVTTRNFILPGTDVKMTLVHDPNAGTYTETLTAPDSGKTVTVHRGISHSWARFEEVKAE
jgi:hypothetical protein